jgi:hypothetical protein
MIGTGLVRLVAESQVFPSRALARGGLVHGTRKRPEGPRALTRIQTRSEPENASGGNTPTFDWRDVSLSTCSYIGRSTSRRASLVTRALETWPSLLALPFAERIFVDDGSPHALGLATLCRTGLHRSFDRLAFNSREHRPHSNFGIVECLTAARTPLIVHLDDDITIRGDTERVAGYLGECLTVMAADPSILGMALLTYENTPAVWGPGDAYVRDARTTPSFELAHPKRFFGTAASVIRRELLERYPLERLYADRDQQLNWERLVSNDPTEFLVDCASSPFEVDPAAWKHRATYRWSAKSELRSFARLIKRRLGGGANQPDWQP